MSVTEVQVIHKVKPAAALSASRGMFYPTDGDKSDGGLIMKIDKNLKDSAAVMDQQSSSATVTTAAAASTAFPVIGMKNPSAVRPSAVSSQLCGHGQGSEVTGWIFRGVLFLQTTHTPFMKFTQKVSEAIQQKVKLLFPAFFYLSLLVLLAQFAAVIILFSQSIMPIGMWFLLACIGILSYLFCYTISSSWTNSSSVPITKIFVTNSPSKDKLR